VRYFTLIHAGRTNLESSDAGPRYQINATKEVILSAGAINTPQILLNSGIGPSSLLDSLKIPTLVNLPSVGQNLTDHPRLANNWFVNSNSSGGSRTFDDINRNTSLSDQLEMEWLETNKGPLVDTFVGQLAFMRLNKSVLEELGMQDNDPANGVNSSHFELGFSVSLDCSLLLYHLSMSFYRMVL